MMQFSHEPVLLQETLSVLAPRPGEVFVDGTVGGGGHSRAILERIAPHGRLIAIDQDKNALAAAKETLAPWREHVTFVHNNFANLQDVLESEGVQKVDGILMDIGVSSHQLDEGERGFSFNTEAPLDMRMDRDKDLTAAQLVNELDAEELTRILRDYGEELWARRIAEFMVARRKNHGPIETTGQLVDVIKAAIPARARRRGPHPARRTFQALRIAVNDELGVLERAVNDGIDCLKTGGRLALITFHSLEDRMVKKIFQHRAAGCQCPPGLPQCACGNQAHVKILTGKPVQAKEDELERNPRARSAKLRAVIKVLNGREGE
ncbi:16S rRNA (cytosine(1402)-N(4))-methyltransferase RsmH [Dethiobacter alkaliphilus]|uniref:16S rRNA (cytosine(1402)-N(4))-methyltransferase RsmH n=1 Tax=Dethiobacter alkaliphilus TaxID=427926 RepID=UPI002961FB0C|nr:16S rRNA (cytosine(1402)-N(4))-methyltransferase RsmH [Dethiobacter alkaliphilus]